MSVSVNAWPFNSTRAAYRENEKMESDGHLSRRRLLRHIGGRIRKKEKARPKHDLASRANPPNNKTTSRCNYFLAVGGGGASLVCAQAPSPKALAITTAIMITFKNFNLSRLLSQQVAPVCLDMEPPGGNAFLNFFERVTTGRQIYLW